MSSTSSQKGQNFNRTDGSTANAHKGGSCLSTSLHAFDGCQSSVNLHRRTAKAYASIAYVEVNDFDRESFFLWSGRVDTLVAWRSDIRQAVR